MEEYIKLLELPDEFDLKELKRAYRKKVLKYHPDKAANEAERIGYEALMKKLNEANEYLKEYLENHGGKYSKSNNTSDCSEDTFADDNTTTEATEEDDSQTSEDETQSYSYGYNEAPKRETFNESISKIRSWIDKNPKKATITIILCIFALIFDIWILTFDSDYTPPENPQTNQQQTYSAPTVPQANQMIPTKEFKIPTNNYTQEKYNLFKTYMNESQRKIKMNWDLPRNLNEENIRVKVGFKLNKYGQLVGTPKIKESSGNEKIDNSCINAVLISAPFGTFPENINEDAIDIEMSFEADKRQ